MNFISLSMVAMSLITSAHFGVSDVKATTEINPAYAVETVSLPTSIESKSDISAPTTKEIVKDYFKDIPILAKVAQCESEFRQFDANGEVLRGIANSFDVGVMQINEKYHLERSKGMNMNIYSTIGNLEYARALYNDSGTAPWSASKPCWSLL